MKQKLQDASLWVCSNVAWNLHTHFYADFATFLDTVYGANVFSGSQRVFHTSSVGYEYSVYKWLATFFFTGHKLEICITKICSAVHNVSYGAYSYWKQWDTRRKRCSCVFRRGIHVRICVKIMPCEHILTGRDWQVEITASHTIGTSYMNCELKFQTPIINSQTWCIEHLCEIKQ